MTTEQDKLLTSNEQIPLKWLRCSSKQSVFGNAHLRNPPKLVGDWTGLTEKAMKKSRLPFPIINIHIQIIYDISPKICTNRENCSKLLIHHLTLECLWSAKFFCDLEYLTDALRIKILQWMWLQCLNAEIHALSVLHFFSQVLYHNDSNSIVSVYTYLGDM